jgi:hypothetical protein
MAESACDAAIRGRALVTGSRRRGLKKIEALLRPFDRCRVVNPVLRYFRLLLIFAERILPLLTVSCRDPTDDHFQTVHFDGVRHAAQTERRLETASR